MLIEFFSPLRASARAFTFNLGSEPSSSLPVSRSSPAESRGIARFPLRSPATLLTIACLLVSKLAVAEGAIYSHLSSLVCARAARSCFGAQVLARHNRNSYSHLGRPHFIHLNGLAYVDGAWSTIVPKVSATEPHPIASLAEHLVTGLSTSDFRCLLPDLRTDGQQRSSVGQLHCRRASL